MDWGIMAMIIMDMEPLSMVNRCCMVLDISLACFLRMGFLTYSAIALKSYEVRSNNYYCGLLDKVSIPFLAIYTHLVFLNCSCTN